MGQGLRTYLSFPSLDISFAQGRVDIDLRTKGCKLQTKQCHTVYIHANLHLSSTPRWGERIQGYGEVNGKSALSWHYWVKRAAHIQNVFRLKNATSVVDSRLKPMGCRQKVKVAWAWRDRDKPTAHHAQQAHATTQAHILFFSGS